MDLIVQFNSLGSKYLVFRAASFDQVHPVNDFLRGFLCHIRLMREIAQVDQPGRSIVQVEEIQTFPSFAIHPCHDRVFINVHVNPVRQIPETDKDTCVVLVVLSLQVIFADGMDQAALGIKEKESADLRAKSRSKERIDRNIRLVIDAYRF
jgi:hypothetical protein